MWTTLYTYSVTSMRLGFTLVNKLRPAAVFHYCNNLCTLFINLRALVSTHRGLYHQRQVKYVECGVPLTHHIEELAHACFCQSLYSLALIRVFFGSYNGASDERAGYRTPAMSTSHLPLLTHLRDTRAAELLAAAAIDGLVRAAEAVVSTLNPMGKTETAVILDRYQPRQKCPKSSTRARRTMQRPTAPPTVCPYDAARISPTTWPLQ